MWIAMAELKLKIAYEREDREFGPSMFKNFTQKQKRHRQGSQGTKAIKVRNKNERI